MSGRASSRVAALGLGVVVLTATGGVRAESADTYRRWILEMKDSERGPFASIRWFCKDGRILAPRDFSCSEKGEGWQHGEWSDRTRRLRSEGYRIATFLAGMDAPRAVASRDFPEMYTQLLVERFLIAADQGWILRKAQFYRGAVQEEDEREGARNLLLALVARDEWIGRRYVALRTGVRLLPHGPDSAPMQRVRNLAAALGQRDPAFQPLRTKIHNGVEASDAGTVRAYARRTRDPGLREDAEALASEIDRLYAPRPLGDRLAAEARALSAVPWLRDRLREASSDYRATTDPAGRYAITSTLLADLRDALPRVQPASSRLRVLDLSIAVEADGFRTAGELRDEIGNARRAALVGMLRAAAEAAYGTGAVNHRERTELRGPLAALSAAQLQLVDYLRALRVLALVPSWGTQSLRFEFGEAMAKLEEIEPLAGLFVQDQLRGGPLLSYSQVLDVLLRDANRLAGARNRLFDRDIGTGLTALNPGLARGVLRAAPDLTRLDELRPDGIYVLPETVADLPPLAGILTAGPGNPLSHVQLLARNLGIPNVAVDLALVPELRASEGRKIVLAVSAAGVVEISADGARWDAVFGKQAGVDGQVTFAPDLAKLDLTRRDFVGLGELRASDSGRIVGPKAARLAELKALFPDRVAPGVAIPFGLYRAAVLDRPYRSSGQTVYAWMVASFRKLEAMPAGSKEAADFAEKLRAEIYSIIRETDPGPEFRSQLRAVMAREFGPSFDGGVFVRSDTNVEDLPGFTGAGLNLTLFNVVGFDNIVKGISEVWASPYTPRAWAWRQAHMKGPEHVYPAVLLLRTVPSDISGVMITQDVDSGDPDVLSVAVNEGMGGAVDGQAAESVRIDRRTGSVHLKATATAARRLVPLAKGGIARLPTSGSETLLGPAEVKQLIAFSTEVAARFPQTGEDGKPVAADVEFAFVDGKLWLLQIRPFNESRAARRAGYLIELDRVLAGNLDRKVEMGEAVP